MGIIIAILLFSFIVIFHEMGHFLIAKANGIEVEEFALGMGPLLFSKEYKGPIISSIRGRRLTLPMSTMERSIRLH